MKGVARPARRGACAEVFRDPRVPAFGVASPPADERDPEGLSRRAAYTLSEGALRGVRERCAGGR